MAVSQGFWLPSKVMDAVRKPLLPSEIFSGSPGAITCLIFTDIPHLEITCSLSILIRVSENTVSLIVLLISIHDARKGFRRESLNLEVADFSTVESRKRSSKLALGIRKGSIILIFTGPAAPLYSGLAIL